MQETIRKFKEILAKLNAYQHALGVMQYDSETAMPRAGAAGYAAAMGALSEEVYKLQTSDAFKGAVRELLSRKAELDEITRREAEVLGEEMARMDCVPVQEFVEYQTELGLASSAWREAKQRSDYALFAPHLQKLLDSTRRFARYYAPDRDPYDVLLDEYEKGMTQAELDRFFGTLRENLMPLVQRVAERADAVDDRFLFGHFPVGQQRRLAEAVMEVMGLDRSRCALGEVEHPFTTNFSKNDVRITTHYHEESLASSLYSVIHEGGHALYELNTDDALIGSPLAGGASMGMHESQSRLYENLIGRSAGFARFLFPKVQALFPAQLAGVTAQDFYRAVNRSAPSLIRIDADELTYPFHILIRYELEKRLIAGDLPLQDLPAEWNRLYKEVLGVAVPDDAHGVLQDSHWSGGSFGYFPSYAIGSAYGAQILESMKKDLDVDALTEAGNLAPITAWLAERIYRFGKVKTPGELLRNACGADFDPQFYVDYLTRKYTALYNL